MSVVARGKQRCARSSAKPVRRHVGLNVSDLERLARLLRDQNRVAGEIAALVGRPALARLPGSALRPARWPWHRQLNARPLDRDDLVLRRKRDFSARDESVQASLLDDDCERAICADLLFRKALVDRDENVEPTGDRVAAGALSRVSARHVFSDWG